MAVDLGYIYTSGISYPQTGQIETQNPLYGDALQELCRETSYNKLRLKKNLFKSDREKAYDIVRWEFGKPNKTNIKQAWYYDGEIPSWGDEDAIFNKEMGHRFACQKSDKQNKEAEDLCYLCSTLEEHQQHAVRRGPQPHRKKKPKPRIKFIHPPPTVKPKEKEVKEKAEVLYRFSVTTGKQLDAGTNANVTVKLKGARGIMREKLLKKKTSVKFVFGRNTTEVFFIKGPEIGDLDMLAVEHDGLEQSQAWYLEEIEVTKMNTEQVWVFVCRDWLSLYHGHYQLKKVIRAEQIEVEPNEYEISVVTADKFFAGTDANVFITLYGRKGVSKKIQLRNRSKNPFEKGSKEDFFVTVKENIGPLCRIRVEHDNSGSGPGWLLDQVTVNDLHTGQKKKFPCGQWLARDEGDGQISRDLYPAQKGEKMVQLGPDETEGRVKGPMLMYEVTVLTGKVRYAGTDARVYLTLIGKRGRSKEVELFDNAKDLFEMGQTDVFNKIEAEDVGEIKGIRVRHDNSGLGAGWFLEKMNIKRFFPKEEIRERLMKLQGEMDESVVKRMAELQGDDVESPRPTKQKVTGSVKVKKKKHSDSDTDDSGDMDATSIFGSYKKKTKKPAHSDDDSDDARKKKYKKEQKKMEKLKRKDGKKHKHRDKHDLSSSSESNTESEESEGEEAKYRKRLEEKLKKKKWISYGGYRMQVTDDELDKKSQKKKQKKEVKYPTDSSSESEDDKASKHKGRERKYSKYMSDSEESDDRYTKGRKNRKHRGSREEEETDTDDEQMRKGQGHRKQQGYTKPSEETHRKGFSSLYKKDRVPYYEEYLFECHRWLAKDEDDGSIDREFKARSVTTFYKMKN